MTYFKRTKKPKRNDTYVANDYCAELCTEHADVESYDHLLQRLMFSAGLTVAYKR